MDKGILVIDNVIIVYKEIFFFKFRFNKLCFLNYIFKIFIRNKRIFFSFLVIF